MSRYRISHDARRDLKAVWHYIANDNETAADHLMDRFHDTFRVLARQPLLGRKRCDLRHGLRAFGCGNYSIFYDRVADGIRTMRVIHGARDEEVIFKT